MQTRVRSCDHKYNMPVVLVRGMPIVGDPESEGSHIQGGGG